MLFSFGLVCCDTKMPWDRIHSELQEYALACFTIPVSIAVAKRFFSYVTLVKTKSRNRMNLPLLDSIVTIRSALHFQEKCCKDFAAAKEMLELFNNKMYEELESFDQPLVESDLLSCEE